MTELHDAIGQPLRVGQAVAMMGGGRIVACARVDAIGVEGGDYVSLCFSPGHWGEYLPDNLIVIGSSVAEVDARVEGWRMFTPGGRTCIDEVINGDMGPVFTQDCLLIRESPPKTVTMRTLEASGTLPTSGPLLE